MLSSFSFPSELAQRPPGLDFSQGWPLYSTALLGCVCRRAWAPTSQTDGTPTLSWCHRKVVESSPCRESSSRSRRSLLHPSIAPAFLNPALNRASSCGSNGRQRVETRDIGEHWQDLGRASTVRTSGLRWHQVCSFSGPHGVFGRFHSSSFVCQGLPIVFESSTHWCNSGPLIGCPQTFSGSIMVFCWVGSHSWSCQRGWSWCCWCSPISSSCPWACGRAVRSPCVVAWAHSRRRRRVPRGLSATLVFAERSEPTGQSRLALWQCWLVWGPGLSLQGLSVVLK